MGLRTKGLRIKGSRIPWTFPVEYIVVAGGGGGPAGGSDGGGGGAGGYRSSISGESSGGLSTAEQPFPAQLSTTYLVSIGAGGPLSNSGSISQLNIIVSLGGGRGGLNASITPQVGGSGGGTGISGVTTGAAGTPRQGFGGGDGCGDAGGGGGAGGPGFAGNVFSTAEKSDGGIGIITAVNVTFVGTADISNASVVLNVTAVSTGIITVGTQVTGANIPAGTFIVSLGTGTGGTGTYNMSAAATLTAGGVVITSSGRYFAGGGGGGNDVAGTAQGGAGGGGAGVATGTAVSGFVNTGGGGGGSAQTGGSGGNGGAGGSGIVILRYPVARTITLGVGLTGTTSTIGANKVTVITAGTDTVSWT